MIIQYMHLLFDGCEVLPPEADPDQAGLGVSCSFESSICAWSQDITDQFDWFLASGSTPSVDTGPTGDHTSGTGKDLQEIGMCVDFAQ